MQNASPLPPDTEQRLAALAQACACNNLRRATRAMTNLYDAALAPTGLLATQCPLLTVLVLAGPLTISAMAEHLVMDRTTVSRNLRPLVAQGLVHTAPGRDQRTCEVTITPQGRAVLTHALPLWEAVQVKVVAQLGASRFGTLLGTLADAVALAQQPA